MKRTLKRRSHLCITRPVRKGGAGGAAAPLRKFENIKGPHFCLGKNDHLDQAQGTFTKKPKYIHHLYNNIYEIMKYDTLHNLCKGGPQGSRSTCKYEGDLRPPVYFYE